MWFNGSTTKGLTMNLGFFAFGATLFAIGAHYSYKNIAPQQARAKARSDLLRAHLIKKFGKDVIPEVYRNDTPPGSVSNQQEGAHDT